MPRRDGGPAFPRPDILIPGENGMSLRDWLAGQALAGLLAAYSAHGQVLPASDRAAKWAYQYADAMLVLREEPPAVVHPDAED